MNSPAGLLQEAFALHGAGKLDQAKALYRRVLDGAPTQPEALHHLGLIEAASGNLDEADRLMTLSDRIAPGNPDWLFNIARLAALKGDLGRARAVLEKILAKVPRHGDALVVLGGILLRLKRFADAKERLRAARRLMPGRPDVAMTLGLAEMALGNGAEAERLCREAAQAAPAWADAHSNLGYVLRMQGRDEEAEAACRQALALTPDHAEALINLGTLAQNRQAQAEARENFERALRARPGHVEARFGLAETAIAAGQIDEGRALLAGLIAENPRNWAARWLDLVGLPLVHASPAGVDDERERFMSRLDDLARDVERYLSEDKAAIVEAVNFRTNFYFHYLGGDVRATQERYGRLIARIAAAAYPAYARRKAVKRKGGGPIRVGFASSFFYSHSVMKSHAGWIQGLPRERFDIVLFHLGAKHDAVTDEVAGGTRLISCAGLDQAHLIERIAAEKLDALVWLDIGMDAKVQVPAALRLAPVQATGFGHPVTSGLPTIDAYLTGDGMEPSGGEAHYTETLVRLPNLSVAYRRPSPVTGDLPEAVRALKEEGRLVYFCGQSLFKLLPVQDEVIAAIAGRLPNAAFVFIAHAADAATAVLRDRLTRRMARAGLSVDGRIVLLPRLSEAAFRAVSGVADVVIDSLEWSGFNSTLEALAAGTPVVAMPGATMRAHHSYGILSMAGLDDLIAADADAYVDLAVRLGEDVAFRDRVRRAVAERSGRVFDDPAPVPALAAWLESAVAAAAK